MRNKIFVGLLIFFIAAVAVSKTELQDFFVKGNISVMNGNSFRFYESQANGQNYIGFKAPAATTASVTLTLPDGAGASGQYLQTNGSDTLSWQYLSSTAPQHSYEISNMGLSTSVASNALTIALKQSDGSTDPSTGSSAVNVGFRSSTATSGALSYVSATSSVSITVPSGATLRHFSGADEYIYVYALNNSGTIELAVSSQLWDERSLQSTTAIDTSSDSVGLYSTTLRSSVPIRLLGRIKSNQTTAGTWASSMSEVSLASLNAFTEPKVSARYYRSSSQSINDATYTTFDFSTKDNDNYNAVSTGTWVFRAPRARKYWFYAQVLSASTSWTAGDQCQAAARVNATIVIYQANPIGAAYTGFCHYNVWGTVRLDVDDELDVQIYQDSGGTLGTNTTAGFNFIEVMEVGEY